LAADFNISLTNPSAKDVQIGVRKIRAGRTVTFRRDRLFRGPQSLGDAAIPRGQDPVQRTIDDLADAMQAGRATAVVAGKIINQRMMRSLLSPDGSSPVIAVSGPTTVEDGIQTIVCTNNTSGVYTVTLPDPRDHEGDVIHIIVNGLQPVLFVAFGSAGIVGVRFVGGTLTARPGRRLTVIGDTLAPELGTAIWRVIADSDRGDRQLVTGAAAIVSPFASFVSVVPPGGGTVLALPSIATTEWGLLSIKDDGGTAAANNITVAAAAGETIDGAATATITANFGVLRLQGFGLNWSVV